MPTLTTIKFSRDNTTYEVHIDFDDEAIMEDNITFDVRATLTDYEGKSYSETLCVELDLNENSGRIFLRETEVYRFSLSDINVRMDPLTGEEAIPGMNGDCELKDNVYDHIQEGLGNVIGEVIDAMPVPDPFFGCLIKASISSIIGQAVTCNELRRNYGNEGRFRQIVSCLRKHVKGIALRTLWRAARCMIRLGF